VNHVHDFGYAFLLISYILFLNNRIGPCKSIHLRLETDFVFVHVHESAFDYRDTSTEHVSESDGWEFVNFLVWACMVVRLEVLGFGQSDSEQVLLLLGVGQIAERVQ
jgi:hypothetical protein